MPAVGWVQRKRGESTDEYVRRLRERLGQLRDREARLIHRQERLERNRQLMRLQIGFVITTLQMYARTMQLSAQDVGLPDLGPEWLDAESNASEAE